MADDTDPVRFDIAQGLQKICHRFQIGNDLDILHCFSGCLPALATRATVVEVRNSSQKTGARQLFGGVDREFVDPFAMMAQDEGGKWRRGVFRNLHGDLHGAAGNINGCYFMHAGFTEAAFYSEKIGANNLSTAISVSTKPCSRR